MFAYHYENKLLHTKKISYGKSDFNNLFEAVFRLKQTYDMIMKSSKNSYFV